MASTHSNRWPQIARLVLLLIFSWPIMLVTHEVGHLLGGWLGGATLKDYDLRPWRLPYSIHDPDPHPLITLWSGPLFGVLVPLSVAILFQRVSLWLFASFCALANGVYFAGGWLSGDRFLDTTMLIDKGTHPALVMMYCFITIPLGYAGVRSSCLKLLKAPYPSSQIQNAAHE